MNDRITIDAKIQHGKPVIRGTRVPVARIVGGLAGGMSWAEIESEYGVTADDIRAALEFASELIENAAPRRTLDRVLGIARGTTPPPDDATVKRWIEEHRQEKYG
ncbi:MAG: hypothetical protein QOF78_3951 [Phycisphaerales bacterium]|jgi:uncharacterized protein (DUF433 family)|nr:hypothetical protein [Phycisphaerales bacterium]